MHVHKETAQKEAAAAAASLCKSRSQTEGAEAGRGAAVQQLMDAESALRASWEMCNRLLEEGVELKRQVSGACLGHDCCCCCYFTWAAQNGWGGRQRGRQALIYLNLN